MKIQNFLAQVKRKMQAMLTANARHVAEMRLEYMFLMVTTAEWV